ncbi:MAG: PTS fructose transporter subunit IIA [Deltaproteobacteria bacterium]|nr:PTS fructose transporter subunit IIA [Deltaproteobacteria bacterium]
MMPLKGGAKMIGVLITTHGNVGQELIRAAELIKGNLKKLAFISIDQSKSVEELQKEINTAIRKLDQGQGVLILTDLFGGTPSNISLSFLKPGKVEVITGVNLPMLLKLRDINEDIGLVEFAKYIQDYGKKNISLASEILNKKITE